ncbi:MAG: PatB family C-S lyase [Muribaculaceae bacterium]|nr:PatB family C-S lyase [Muribaculaceae bacterium]
MKYNFDEVIERRGTGALKTDRLKERFGRDDLLAAWVADMDFATPPFIIDALKKRLEHPIFGYGVEPDEYRPLIIAWEKELHDWNIKPEWISYIPGIVKGLGFVINVFTQPGDDVFIMPPVYHPFRITAELNGRNVVNIPLIEKDGNYSIDFEKLESVHTTGGVLILSNPHNPDGRIWTKDELSRLAKICKQKNILVISDEIHADMALWGNRHVPYMTVSDEARDNSITFCAPSKVFNIPGIVSSFAVVPNPEIRDKFYGWLKANELNEAPEFSYVATCAAYKEGWEWRKQMLDYVEKNIEAVEEFCEKELPGIKALRPEASFLIWLDCRNLGLSQPQLVDLFLNKARVALNDGAMFGNEGEGFMRLNVAMPKKKLMEVLERIKEALA